MLNLVRDGSGERHQRMDVTDQQATKEGPAPDARLAAGRAEGELVGVEEVG
ncbi:MAG: hypothetical protein ACXW08_13415 [Solirubrobacteraceae bacterium]